MYCFQAANFSNNQRKIPEQVLAFLERQVVLLDPTKCVQTAAISSEGLAAMLRNFLSLAQVTKRVCWENTFPNTSVTCAVHINSLEIPYSLSHEFSSMFFKAIILKSFGGGVFLFFKETRVGVF